MRSQASKAPSMNGNIDTGCEICASQIIPAKSVVGLVGFGLINLISASFYARMCRIAIGGRWRLWSRRRQNDLDPEFSNDNLGRSIIISRTESGEALLKKAESNKKIELNKISGIKVARSQGMMRFKKNGLPVRVRLFKLNGKETPIYYAKTLKPGLIDYPRSCIIVVNQRLASNRSLWWMFAPFISLQNQLKKGYKMLSHSPH